MGVWRGRDLFVSPVAVAGHRSVNVKVVINIHFCVGSTLHGYNGWWPPRAAFYARESLLQRALERTRLRHAKVFHVGGAARRGRFLCEKTRYARLLELVVALPEPFEQPRGVLGARDRVFNLLKRRWYCHNLHNRRDEPALVVVPVYDAADIKVIQLALLGPFLEKVLLDRRLGGKDIGRNGPGADRVFHGVPRDDELTIESLVLNHLLPQKLRQALSARDACGFHSTRHVVRQLLPHALVL